MLDTDRLADALVTGAKRYVDAALRPVIEQHRLLEASVADMRARMAAMPAPVGIAGFVRDETGVLILTLSNGTTLETGIRSGRDGVDGKEGPAGQAGPPGPPGRDGVDGKNGAAGERGVAGRDGVDGLAGAPGADGKDGAQGERGAAGRDGVDGKDGKDGNHGKDADLEALAGIIKVEVGEAVAAHTAAEDREGRDPETIAALVMDRVSEKLAALPPPAAGPPGRDGKDGCDGQDGRSVDLVGDVVPAIEEVVASAVAALPRPKDGVNGKDGVEGKDGRDGRDGIGTAGALIDRNGDLILTLTDGTTRTLGRIVGKDGEPGKPGRDGFGFDEMTAELAEDGRTLILRWQRGEDVKEQRLTPAIPLDRGVWREGAYAKGDAVSFGGSVFIAQRDTTDKPETSDAWRLAVKRGRDGKDGKVKAA